MKSICGIDCTKCDFNKTCKGCAESNGCPFGKECFIANYIKSGGMEKYLEYKQKLIEEFNALCIPGMTKINELYALCGSYVNLEYPLPSGQTAKFLADDCIYLGNQVENIFGGDKCFGLVAGTDFLLVCKYAENGTNPEIIIYKKR